MNTKLSRDKTKAGGKMKENNARCTFCRKCYNTGLCMMPWPEFSKGKQKEIKN